MLLLGQTQLSDFSNTTEKWMCGLVEDQNLNCWMQVTASLNPNATDFLFLLAASELVGYVRHSRAEITADRIHADSGDTADPNFHSFQVHC